MNAKQVCEGLGLSSGYLVEILKRELAYQHELLAAEARSALGPERGGFHLQHLAHLLALIAELEEEWDRENPDEDLPPDDPAEAEEWAAERRRLWAIGGARELKGDGAKEASSAAVARPAHDSRRPA